MSGRVIKYRVWDIKRERLAYPKELLISQTGVEFGDGGSPRRTTLDGVVLEQFTGLLDSKGQEIYEGDIIEYFDWCYASDCRPNGREPIKWWFEPFVKEYSHTDVYYPLIGAVTWDQVACTWAPTISSTDDFNESSFAYVCRRELGSTTQLNSRGLSNYPASYYRVLGNIHQHPDLLKTI